MRKWLGCLLVLCGLAFAPSAHAQFIATSTPIFISEQLIASASTGTVPPTFVITEAAHTALTAGVERFDTQFNSARTVQWATGALTTQRFNVFQAPTIDFVGASTVTNTCTLCVTGAPVKGTNATLTSTHGLLIQAGAVSTAAAAYGLTVNTPTGATLNYAAQFLGGQVLFADGSITAPTLSFAAQTDLGFWRIAQRVVGLKGTSGGNTGLVIPSDNTNGANLSSSGAIVGGNAVIGFTQTTSGTALDIADAMFGRVGAASIRMGNVASASPVAQTLSHQNATGSTIAAATPWTFIGPLGTGLANTGAIVFQVAVAKQAVAATLHTASTVLTLGNAQSAHPGAAGALIDAPAATWSDENTANSGTAAIAYMRNFAQPTLIARGTLVTTTNAANLVVAGPPIASTNMTTTNVHGLLITAGSAVGATAGYGLTATAPTGATTNYAAQFSGSVLLGSVIFTALGTPANGTITYCSDCDAPTLVDSTCTHAGGQTGSLAVRANGAWKCIS